MANPIKSVEQAFNSAIEAVTGILKAGFSNLFASNQMPDTDSDFSDPSNPSDYSEPTALNPNLKTEVFTSFKTEVSPEISNKESQDHDQKETQDLGGVALTTQYDNGNQPVQPATSGDTTESNPTQKLITDIHTILRKKK